ILDLQFWCTFAACVSQSCRFAGWLDLASARHSMGPSCFSSTLFDHKERSAATKLQVVDHDGLKNYR
ncbi:hypothetical protein ACJX0J_022629, partial [Zea mays]